MRFTSLTITEIPQIQAFGAAALAVAGLTFSAGPAHAQPPGTLAAEKKIRADYVLTTGPLLKHDIETIISLTAPDFSDIALGGAKMSRSDWVKDERSCESFLGPKVNWYAAVGAIQWNGPLAVVVVQQDMKTTLTDHGHAHKFEQKGTVRDTWERVGGVWMVRNSTDLAQQNWVDGKLQQ